MESAIIIRIHTRNVDKYRYVCRPTNKYLGGQKCTREECANRLDNRFPHSSNKNTMHFNLELEVHCFFK